MTTMHDHGPMSQTASANPTTPLRAYRQNVRVLTPCGVPRIERVKTSMAITTPMPRPSDATQTAVNPRAAGYVTVAPCGSVPLASSLNYVAGDLVTNVADSALDGAGRLCVTTSVATDLVVDLAGVWK